MSQLMWQDIRASAGQKFSFHYLQMTKKNFFVVLVYNFKQFMSVLYRFRSRNKRIYTPINAFQCFILIYRLKYLQQCPNSVLLKFSMLYNEIWWILVLLKLCFSRKDEYARVSLVIEWFSVISYEFKYSHVLAVDGNKHLLKYRNH